MIKLTRTQGPFTAGVGKSLGIDIIGVFSTPDKVVAICGKQYAKDMPESMGNAFLFSASLDMYDAIKAALCDDPDWRRLCVDALEKAEGRTK